MSYIGGKPSKELASPTSQYFNGDGSTTVFTLNRPVNVSEDLDVFVSNVRQEPGVGKSYTAAGTSLTFDAAPPSGTANVYVVYRGLAEITTRLEHDANAALAATTGTFSGAVSAASATVSGDLTIDTSTLYVDSANNRVGVGTTSTVAQSKMTVAGNSLSITGYDNGFTSGGNRAMIDFGANYMRLGGLTGGGSTVNGIKFITPAGGDAAILDSDGLKFNGDTAAANALDDYEEGTWTPTLSTGTCSTGYSKYTKIGNLVRLQAQLYSFSDRGTASAVIVNGLPFTSASNGRSSQGVMARFVTSGGDAVAAYIFQSSSQLTFYACKEALSYIQVQHNHLNSSSSTLFISITYLV